MVEHLHQTMAPEDSGWQPMPHFSEIGCKSDFQAASFYSHQILSVTCHKLPETKSDVQAFLFYPSQFLSVTAFQKLIQFQ